MAPIKQTYTAVIDLRDDYSTTAVLEWIRQAIRRFELHEVDEFFVAFGKRFHDPHAPGVDPDPQDTTA